MKVLATHACRFAHTMQPASTRVLFAQNQRQTVLHNTQSASWFSASLFTTASPASTQSSRRPSQLKRKGVKHVRMSPRASRHLTELRQQVKTAASPEVLAKCVIDKKIPEQEKHNLVFDSPVSVHHVTEGLTNDMEGLFKCEKPEAIIKQISRAHERHFLFGRTSLGRDVRRQFYSELENHALRLVQSGGTLKPSQVVDITRVFSRKSAKEVYSPRGWFSWLGDELDSRYTPQQLGTITYACGLSSMYVAGLTPVVEKMLQTIAGKQPAKVARLDMATTLRAYFAMVRLDPECGDVLGGPAVQAFSPFIPKSAQDVTNPKGQSVTPMHPDEVALWAWTTCSTPAVSDPMVKEALLYLLSYIGGNGRLEDSSQNVFETTTFMPHQLMSMTFQVYLSVANLAQERLPLSRPQKAALAKIKHSFANGGRDEEQPETPNRSEQKLAQTVGALNLGSVQPQFKAKNGYTIDVAVPEKKLAFEFQGPTHFSSAPAMINQRIPMAGLQLKQRHLKAEGWRVVHIPFWEWAELRIVDRSKYLTEKIKESKNKLPVGEPNTSAHYANETEVPDFEGLETPRRGTLWKSVGNFREDRHKGPRGKRPSFDVVASYLKDRRNKLSDRSAKLLAEDYGREYDLSEEERERIRRYLRKSPEPATN